MPWDREQDYDSVKGLLLEEAYEVIDAINARDFKGLEDELGDLLFQVVFYSRLAEEEGRFDIDSVIERVHAKLIRRHPHVFGEVHVSNADEALKSWLNVKEQERGSPAQGKEDEKSVLEGIAPALPATLEAYELGLRASEVGFDWKKVEDLLEKVEEEIREWRRELNGDPATLDASPQAGRLIAHSRQYPMISRLCRIPLNFSRGIARLAAFRGWENRLLWFSRN